MPFHIGGLRFEAFTVEHSLRAPAVGYRVSGDGVSFFYVPDLAAICEQHAALRGVSLYVGDGATVMRSMVRRRDHVLIGHASIAAQLALVRGGEAWRARSSPIAAAASSTSDARKVAARIGDLGEAHGVEASVAYDGLTLDSCRAGAK